MRYEIIKNDFIDVKLPIKPFGFDIHRIYRIIALKEFQVQDRTIKEGEIGGYISGYHNLDQDDNSWVFNLGRLIGNAKIKNGCIVQDNASVYHDAQCEHSLIKNFAKVYGNSIVAESIVSGKSDVRGKSIITKSDIFNSVIIEGNSNIESSIITDGVYVRDSEISYSDLRDTCEVVNSKIENCHLRGRTIVRGQQWKHTNKSTDVILNISTGDGEY